MAGGDGVIAQTLGVLGWLVGSVAVAQPADLTGFAEQLRTDGGMFALGIGVQTGTDASRIATTGTLSRGSDVAVFLETRSFSPRPDRPMGQPRKRGGHILDEKTQTALIDIMRDAARTYILPRYRALTPDQISTKSGPGDLVTLADTEAEVAMTAAIRALLPQATVVGEEAIAATPALRDRIGSADPCVILDPVDGTWNFAKGLSVFGMILAVTAGPKVTFGVLYDPLLDDWIVATDDGPAFYVRRGGQTVLRTSPETRVNRFVGFLPFGLFPRAARGPVMQALSPYSRISSLRCACHEYRMVAMGHAEFALSGPTQHAWDHAAGVLAVERAGGVARFLDGAPYDPGRRQGPLLVAASHSVWDDVARRVAGII